MVSRLWPPLVVCGRVSRARAFGTMYGSSDFGGRTRTCGTSTRGGVRHPGGSRRRSRRGGADLVPRSRPHRGVGVLQCTSCRLQREYRLVAWRWRRAVCSVHGLRVQRAQPNTAECVSSRALLLIAGVYALHRAPSAPRRLGPSPRWCRRRPRAPAPGAPSCARPPPAPSRGSAQRPAPPPAAQAETGSGSNPLLAKRDRLRFCESGRRAQKTRGRLACRFVRRSVSGARPTQNESASNLVTVRQTPLTAMLQPR